MANRFEQVDDPVADAITVALEQRIDGQWAKVLCPKTAHPELDEDKISGDLAPTDALSSAVKLANLFKLEIVIQDRDHIWKKEWGELYRDDGEPSEG